MKKIILLTMLFISYLPLKAQGQTVTVQPKIMVVPYVKEGEDLRTILESDVNKRITLAKIREAFDNRGFTTVDFVAKMKAVSQNTAFIGDNQTDLKAMVIEGSGADIYVEAEMSELFSSTGNAVKVIVTAYETSTGNSLSNKVGDSGKFYTDDVGKLATKAIELVAEEFLNTMQMKFTDIVNNGKSVIIDVSFAEGSAYTTESEMNDGNLFSDTLEMWMEENAYKNNYHIQGTTDLRMIFDDVRIPLKDPANGRNYNPNKFAMQLHQFLKGLGMEIGRSIKGSTIYITIK